MQRGNFGIVTRMFAHTRTSNERFLYSRICDPLGWGLPIPAVLPSIAWQQEYRVLPSIPAPWRGMCAGTTWKTGSNQTGKNGRTG